MEITFVAVSYSELRSKGDFSNIKYGIKYGAKIGEGESPLDCRRELIEKAIKDVKLLHGDEVENVKLVRVEEKVEKIELPF